jgi:hypothetical protein
MKGLSKEELGDNSEITQILKNIGFVSSMSKQEAGRDYIKMLTKDLF